jgi:hypothetical protein
VRDVHLAMYEISARVSRAASRRSTVNRAR